MPTIYQCVLGKHFESLHPVLGRFLGDENGGKAAGRMRVVRFGGWLRHFVASRLGIPPAGEYDLILEVTPHRGGQKWVRHFGKHCLSTCQCEHRGLLVESSGPASIGFELIVEGKALLFQPRRAWVLGLPLPLLLAPHITAENWPVDDKSWRVRVTFSVPLLGMVAEYEGVVKPQASTEPG